MASRFRRRSSRALVEALAQGPADGAEPPHGHDGDGPRQGLVAARQVLLRGEFVEHVVEGDAPLQRLRDGVPGEAARPEAGIEARRVHGPQPHGPRREAEPQGLPEGGQGEAARTGAPSAAPAPGGRRSGFPSPDGSRRGCPYRVPKGVDDEERRRRRVALRIHVGNMGDAARDLGQRRGGAMGWPQISAPHRSRHTPASG